MGKISDRFAARRNKVKVRQLIGAYWGYHPPGTQCRDLNDNQLSEQDRGCFEFSNMTLTAAGLPDEIAQEVVNAIYEATQQQLAHIKTLSPAEQQRFIDEEQRRLDAVIADFDTNGRRRTFETLVKLTMVACCAISTLVAAGRIKQDNLNGDSFMFSS